MQKATNNYEAVMRLAIPKWASAHELEYEKCCRVWQDFFFLVTLIGEGCSDDMQSRLHHGSELDRAGAEFLASYIDIASVDALQSPYLHKAACHLGDQVRRWGSLTRWSSQPAEAVHQWIKFYSKHRSDRRRWVKTTTVNMVVRQSFADQPARRTTSQPKPTTKFGHRSKADVRVHEETKAVTMQVKRERRAVAEATAKTKATKKAKKRCKQTS